MKVAVPFEEISEWSHRAYPDGFFIASLDGVVERCADFVCDGCGALILKDGSPLCDCFMGRMYSGDSCSVGEAWPLMTQEQKDVIEYLRKAWDEVDDPSPWIEGPRHNYLGYVVTCVAFYSDGPAKGEILSARERIIKPNGVIIDVH